MTTDMQKTSIPDVLEKFRQYHSKNPSWGSLHIVLDDKNIKNEDVVFCINDAIVKNDEDGKILAETLLIMSKTQRIKLSRIA